MTKVKKYLPQLIGITLGVIGGYLYFYFIGCRSGACSITANPWLSMLWGAALGYLLGDLVKSYVRKPQ
ncbi:MAG TPA: DUF6132 family protein [Bacteroidales bacterium]|nr:DUF6132 family protein [Bacteroidales bacterium]